MLEVFSWWGDEKGGLYHDHRNGKQDPVAVSEVSQGRHGIREPSPIQCVLQQLGIPMDRLHRYLSHGDSLWLCYVSVVELLKVEPEAVPIARSFGSQAGVVVAGCGSDGNTPASLGLGKEAYYQSLDPQPDRQTPVQAPPRRTPL